MHCQLFSSDIDGTVAGNLEAAQRFKSLWQRLGSLNRPALCYNTGRRVDDARAFVQEAGLPEPDMVIGGVGTEIYDRLEDRMLPEYHESFGGHWDPDAVRLVVEAFPEIERQPPSQLHPYKSSWYWNNASRHQIQSLERKLAEAGLHVCVIYSSDRDLDVLPSDANKGNALRWLAKRREVPLESVIVAGDSGNDSSMFYVPGVRGILVGNARPELVEAVAGLPVYHAEAEMADGVIEGLKHYGIFE